MSYKRLNRGTLVRGEWCITPEGEHATIAEISTHGISIDRIIECWNACINLEHPEEDIKKIIEAPKFFTESTVNCQCDFKGWSPNMLTAYRKNNEALDLIKE
jgi:hypothetical protein